MDPRDAKQPAVAARGPLVVSGDNPRYFSVAGDSRLVYLTGAHFNNSLQDGLGSGRDCPEEPERFDFEAYLAFLAARGHNFIRFWRWEQFDGYLPGADVHFCMTPQPWLRSGPGTASDGKARFDLTQFDHAYFDRLRARVAAAGAAGIYASVMLFDGFSMHLTEVPIEHHRSPVPRLEQRQRRRHRVHRRLPGAATRSFDRGPPGRLHPPRRRHRARPSERAVRGRQRVVGCVRRRRHDAGRHDDRDSERRLDPVAVLGDRRHQTSRARYRTHAAPDRDDVPVPSRRPAGRQRSALAEPSRLDLTWLRRHRGAVRQPVASRSPGQRRRQGRHLRHRPLLPDGRRRRVGVEGVPARPQPDPLRPRHRQPASIPSTRRSSGRLPRTPVGSPTSRPAQPSAWAPPSTGFALARPDDEYVALHPAGDVGPFTLELRPGTYAVRWFDIDDRIEEPGDDLVVERVPRVGLISPFGEDRSSVVHLTRRR